MWSQYSISAQKLSSLSKPLRRFEWVTCDEKEVYSIAYWTFLVTLKIDTLVSSGRKPIRLKRRYSHLIVTMKGTDGAWHTEKIWMRPMLKCCCRVFNTYSGIVEQINNSNSTGSFRHRNISILANSKRLDTGAWHLKWVIFITMNRVYRRIWDHLVLLSVACESWPEHFGEYYCILKLLSLWTTF